MKRGLLPVHKEAATAELKHFRRLFVIQQHKVLRIVVWSEFSRSGRIRSSFGAAIMVWAPSSWLAFCGRSSQWPFGTSTALTSATSARRRQENGSSAIAEPGESGDSSDVRAGIALKRFRAERTAQCNGELAVSDARKPFAAGNRLLTNGALHVLCVQIAGIEIHGVSPPLRVGRFRTSL